MSDEGCVIRSARHSSISLNDEQLNHEVRKQCVCVAGVVRRACAPMRKHPKFGDDMCHSGTYVPPFRLGKCCSFMCSAMPEETLIGRTVSRGAGGACMELPLAGA